MKYVNPHMFFFLDGAKIGLWDYVNNEHFHIERSYLDRILELQVEPGSAGTSEIDADLLFGGAISANEYTKIEWEWGKASEATHFAAKNFDQVLSLDSENNYTRKYLEICADLYEGVTEDDLRHRRAGERVLLPNPDTSVIEKISLWDAIRSRKTTRTFFDEPMTMEQLSLVLYCSFGEIHGRWSELEDRGLQMLGVRKSVPSGGATHSCQAYVVVLNTEGLAKGIYHYESDTHSLIKISDADCSNSLGRLVSGQLFANKLGVGIFVTSCFDKIWVKYKHSRAYRVPFIDAGHLSQMVHITANAIGLNSWLSGVFRDDEVSDLLEIDPLGPEQPLLFLGFGCGSGDYLHPELINAIAELKSAK